MDFTKINEVGRLESSFLPTKKLTELEKDENFRVTAVRQVTTKFGPRIIVDVDNIFSVFLPARMAKLLTDDGDAFSKLTCASEQNRLFMRYLGGTYNNVEFMYI